MPQYQKQETGGCENTMLLLLDFILLNNIKSSTNIQKTNKQTNKNKPKPTKPKVRKQVNFNL